MSGNPLWEFLEYIKARPDLSFALSADLTSATDRIPLSVANALIEGFLDRSSINRTHPIRTFFPLGAVPSYISCDTSLVGGGPSRLESWHLQKCGTLMGAPLSFEVLTLFSLSLVEAVEISHYNGWPYRLGDAIVSRPEPVKLPCAVVGDDVLILTNRSSCRTYTHLVRKWGGAVSAGKHTYGDGAAVFCEDYVLNQGGKHKSEWAYLDLIKPRLLSPYGRTGSQATGLPIIGKGSMLRVQIEYSNNRYSINRNIGWRDPL